MQTFLCNQKTKIAEHSYVIQTLNYADILMYLKVKYLRFQNY